MGWSMYFYGSAVFSSKCSTGPIIKALNLGEAKNNSLYTKPRPKCVESLIFDVQELVWGRQFSTISWGNFFFNYTILYTNSWQPSKHMSTHPMALKCLKI